MTRYKIIINPSANSGAIIHSLPQIDSDLRSHNLDFEFVYTGGTWHAAELAYKAAVNGWDVVVAAGGDGTINEVVNGLMTAPNAGSAQAALGVLPVGRGNDFTFSMGIPAKLKEACAILARNQRRRIDLGRVYGGFYPEGRFFCNGVGIGFDAVVGFVANQNKNSQGTMAYVKAALKTMWLYHKGCMLRIESDSFDLTQQTLMVSVMNGRRMGGAFLMAPNSQPDDGLLDLCIVRQLNIPKIMALMPHFFNGTQIGHAAVHNGHTRYLRVIAQKGGIPAHADGETICVSGDELVIESIPAALDLVC